MGLKDKAGRFKKGHTDDKLDHLEVYLEGRVLKRPELLELKSDIQDRIQLVSSDLQKRILDLEHLIEICEELSIDNDPSVMSLSLIRRMKNQFAGSECAVFILSDQAFTIIGRNGLPSLRDFPARMDFINFLSGEEPAVPISRLTGFGQEQFLMEEAHVEFLIPLMSRNHLAGLIAALLPDKHGFTESEMSFLNVFSSISSIFLDHSRITQEPFRATIGAVRDAVRTAAAGKRPVVFLSLKLTNLSRYQEFYGSIQSEAGMRNSVSRLKKDLPKSNILRYNMKEILIILQEVASSETKNWTDKVYKVIRESFPDESKIGINPDLLTVSYPECPADPLEIFRLLSK